MRVGEDERNRILGGDKKTCLEEDGGTLLLRDGGGVVGSVDIAHRHSGSVAHKCDQVY